MVFPGRPAKSTKTAAGAEKPQHPRLDPHASLDESGATRLFRTDPPMSPRPLSPTLWASPQLAPAALPGLAEAGVRRIISNRPDHEDPGQPTAAEMEAAAKEAGLSFLWIPVSGMPAPDQVQAVAEALVDGQPTVLFCRSGMRSAAIWAMSERSKGADEEDLRTAAAAAGYDLSRLPL